MAQGRDTSEGGFFSRWSQRKQESLRDAAPDDLPDAADRDAPRSTDAGRAAADPETAGPSSGHSAEPELSAEELAALPRIEDLTPQTDIRAFMRPGVPKSLRNAALRKMWLITPAIRDHIDPAVDYAWDWNTPGGVPGDGVAPSPEKAAQMLRDLMKPRRAVQQPDAETEGNADPEDESQSADTVVADARPPDASANVPQRQQTASERMAPGPETAAESGPEDPTEHREGAHVMPPARKHGGALPR